MSTTTVTFTPAAAAMVKEEVSSFKRDNRRHANYVAEMATTDTPVTTETVAAHVAAFREAFKAANKNATGDEIKAFGTKVRNGLNRVIGKAAAESEPTDYLARAIKAVTDALEHDISISDILSQFK